MRRFGYFFVPMLVFIPLAALVLMLLWNWLFPALFAIGTITYWQSLGLLILLRLLIGPRFGFGFYRPYGWRGHHWHRRGYFWKRRFYEKLKNLTPEEKEKFKERMRYRYCAPFDMEEGEIKTEEKPA